MSLTQIDKDFLTIKKKVLSENETFLKKFQNNLDYSIYKKKYNRSIFLPIMLVVLFCVTVGCGVYFLYKYFPKFYLYEFIIGAILILLAFMFLVIKFTNRIKQEKSVNKNGYYFSVLTIENNYDKILNYMNSINLEKASNDDKLAFYSGLGKVFGTISAKFSKIYSNKALKIKKIKHTDLDWNWLLKYLYNFGKFCYNKKKDCKSFTSLLNM